MKGGGSRTTPCPIRIREVCWAAAASQTSGAPMWENSSRKWCSTAHTCVKPASSAAFTCSMLAQYVSASVVGPHGLGTCISNSSP